MVYGTRSETSETSDTSEAAEALRAMPRLFVAVPLAEEARSVVADLVDEVRAEVDGSARPRTAVRWVRMDGLHLTLRFLGPTATAQIDAVEAAVDAAAAGTAPFEVTIRGAGAFPSPMRPRTLWLGLDEGHAALERLAGELDQRLAGAGWPPVDRPFRAHLTLARADGRRAGPATAAALMRRAAAFRAAFAADRLVLFESLTGGGPARYVAHHEALLGR
jgi:RNA 2',3'-cyclic 3'-phosphodiesterase